MTLARDNKLPCELLHTQTVSFAKKPSWTGSGDRKWQAAGRQVIKSTTGQTKQHPWCQVRSREGRQPQRPLPVSPAATWQRNTLSVLLARLPPSQDPGQASPAGPCRVSSIWNHWEIKPFIQKYCLGCFYNTRGSIRPPLNKKLFLNQCPIKPAVSKRHLRSGKSSSTCIAAGQPLITHDAAHCLMTFKRKS